MGAGRPQLQADEGLAGTCTWWCADTVHACLPLAKHSGGGVILAAELCAASRPVPVQAMVATQSRAIVGTQHPADSHNSKVLQVTCMYELM